VGESLGPVRALAEGKPGELFIGTTKNAIIRAAFPDTLTPIVQVETPENVPVCFNTPSVTVRGVLNLTCVYRDTQMSCGVWTSILPWSSLLPAHRTDRFTSGTPSPTSPFGARPSRFPSQWGRSGCRHHDWKGHSSFITHLDWSKDSQYLVTNSGDYEILFCTSHLFFCLTLSLTVSPKVEKLITLQKIKNFTFAGEGSSGKHVTNMDTVRNLEWFTSTCTLSFSAFGRSFKSQ
ncbi:hypothetical protein XENOCAPTIV_015506, partial [Xenoophorus captivus]